MSEVLEANIFFFITSIAVIVFTLLLCVVLYHILKIVKSVRRIIERVEAGSEVIAEDAAHMRAYFTEGSFFSKIIGAFLGSRDVKVRRPKPVKKNASKSSSKARTKLKIMDEDE